MYVRNSTRTHAAASTVQDENAFLAMDICSSDLTSLIVTDDSSAT
jgi:hypothetical protein